MDSINKIKKIIPIDESEPKFGQGSPQKEKTCKEINLFMICYGITSLGMNGEIRRILVDPDTKLKDIKKLFGRNFDQEFIRDENGFIFSEEDLDKSLYNFSNKCCLNINFTYDYNKYVTKYINWSTKNESNNNN
jgi:hypothetical protein